MHQNAESPAKKTISRTHRQTNKNALQCSVIGVAGAVAGHLEELVVVLRSIVQSPGDTPPVDIWEQPANISNIGTQ